MYGNLIQRVPWAVFLALVGATDLASAQDGIPQDDVSPGQSVTPAEGDDDSSLDSSEDPWRISLTPMIWAIGLDGDVGVGSVGASVDASFLDLLDESDSVVGFTGRLEVAHGRLGGFVDGAYAKLGVDDAGGALGLPPTDVTSELAVLDFGIMYRFAEWTPDGDARDHPLPGSFDAYVGGRLMHLELELDPSMLAGVNGDETWVDPIVGGRIILPLNEDLHLLAMGDVGGLGASSDFTWSATATLGYDFTLWDRPASLRAGYRAIGHDYTDGSGADEIIWDVTMHGPIFGLTIRF